MKSADLIIRRMAQLATCAGPIPKRKESLLDLGIIEQAAIASLKGSIVFVGPDKELEKEVKPLPEALVVEAEDMVGLPGFIDPHTHLPFVGTREEEFLLRLRGATYQELAAKGLGIQTTVRATRQASQEEMVRLVLERLDSMLLMGTTTVEAKSGYGLDFVTEIKQLEALQKARQVHPVEIVSTFLGAHEVPPEFKENKKSYLQLLAQVVMPEVRQRELAEFVDIFCEQGVFSVEETRFLAEQAKRLGFKIRLHADEFTPLGGAELAVELGASSADHLIHITEKGINSLAKSSTVAIFLPVVPLFLKLKKQPPARQLIDAGAIVALATDFNPGSSMSESMLLAVQLAVFLLDMQVEEALLAATANAAFALNRHKYVGSLEPGKQLDLILCAIPNYLHLVYHLGPNPVRHVFKAGKWVVRDGKISQYN